MAVLGFNKWPSINHYTRSFDFDCENWHVSKTFSIIADYLQLDKKHLHSYDLHIPQDVNHQVREYLAALNGRNVVINILPGIRTVVCRRRSWLRLSPLCQDYPDVNIILLDHRDEIRIPRRKRSA